MAEKLDLKKVYKELFNTKDGEFKKVHCPVANYLAIEGKGDPNTNSTYQKSIESLYNVAYGVKFKYKAYGKDFVIMPLSVLWWADDISNFVQERKECWKWILMIQIPDFVLEEDIERIKEEKDVEGVYFKKYYEGDAVQTLYVGSYAEEGTTIAKIHNTIKELGGEMRFLHHEIYLNDPRKVQPEKLKTIIRQPAFFQEENKLDFELASKEFYEILDKKSIIVLSTSENDRVTSRNMSCIMHNDKIYYQSDKGHTKSIQVMNNKNVSLCIDNLQIEGIVTRVGSINDKDLSFFKEKYKKKYQGSYNAYSNLINNGVFEVEITNITIWNYDGENVFRDFINMKKKVAFRDYYLKYEK